jgi:hypothetical protein
MKKLEFYLFIVLVFCGSLSFTYDTNHKLKNNDLLLAKYCILHYETERGYNCKTYDNCKQCEVARKQIGGRAFCDPSNDKCY